MTLEQIKLLQEKATELERLKGQRQILKRMKNTGKVTISHTGYGERIDLNSKDSIKLASEWLERISKRIVELEIWIEQQ